MNALFLALGIFVVYFIGYRFYARLVEKQLDIDPGRPTPAHTEYDGVDFVPAKHWLVLFGHHFSSIAGAAPIVGPILAISIWGWGPTIVWILLGVIFIGGVHDFASLMVSVKNKGVSIADITEETISRRSRYVFLWFVWLTLILIIAVFVYLCAKTLAFKPEIVVPSLGLIPIAVIAGIMIYNMKCNQTVVALIGILCLIGLIFLGKQFPLSIGENAIMKWGIVLLIYSFVASVTPVQILLQPRDFLSAHLLFLGLLFGYAGIAITKPEMQFPAFIAWNKGGMLPLWPVLFVTVACGAISGFHALVASGTTSKQLSNEAMGKRIGYGSMVAEGLVAALALIVVATYFKDAGSLREVLDNGTGPIGVFGMGYGNITKTFLGGFGGLFAIIILNAFILTTLDTATRIGRYLTQELFKIKNRFGATIIVVVLSGWLGLSGEWSEIWPIFGAANQLIAALTLIVLTSWLLSKNKLIRYTLFPAVFMLVTAVAALIFKVREYLSGGKNMLLFFAVALLILAVFVLWEAVRHVRKRYA
ncbi:MAG: carbon starvation protein A [Candidatus Omnitrophica bacterium]|nr:carbon starvation protein A [Candidatus Omnitrophota bacterium]